MKGPRGLRSRIVWTTAIVSAVAMSAMIVTVVLALNSATRSAVRTTLEDRFSVLATSVANGKDNPSEPLEVSDDAIDDTTWLYDANGVQLDGPKASARVRKVARSLSRVSERQIVTSHERLYLAGPVQLPRPYNQKGVLVVSKSLQPFNLIRTEIMVGLAVLGLLVTAGATGIAGWTVSRTLAQVEAMASLADEWSEQDLDRRFEESEADNEIGHLGRTINALLDRVAGALRSEQRLTSELAHELRTPLTALRGEAELALMASPAPDTAQRMTRVVALSERMGDTITALLDLARGVDSRATRTTVAELVTTALASSAAPPEIVVLQDLPGEVRLDATSDFAARALAPLVENAVRHAHSRVVITGLAGPRSVDLTVSDDGPGLGQADPHEIFQGRPHSPSDGHAGLGLPLARRVAHMLGGEVRVTSTGSPTSFTLTLPRA